jgi:histidine kinase
MRTRIFLLLLSALAVLMATFFAWQIVSAEQLQELKRQAAENLSLKRSGVLAEIERYRNLPFVLGQDERVQRLLDTQDDPGTQDNRPVADAANRYLETVNRSPKSDQFFVLNAEGTALASSNWRDAKSFVGQSYKFRPYFRDAIAQGEGHHYAVGATTGIPGYFLSLRIDTAAGNTGVVVVKVDISALEKAWAAAGERISLVDDVGIIFLSSVDGWKYRPLAPLSEEVRDRIHSDKLYPDQTINAPPLLQSRPDAETDFYMPVHGASSLLRFVAISEQGWWILASYDVAPVYLAARIAAAIAFLAATLLFVLGFYLLERRYRARADQLREILENMSSGVAVFDPQLRLVAWNNKYLTLNSYPQSLVQPGRQYADIIRYNIARGDLGPGDPKKLLQERLDRIRQLALRQFEVHRADGTWVDVVRNRMPDGTLIQTYTDITERKHAEAELNAHRNNLEGLVAERTAELVRLNERLRETMAQTETAKRQAEQADRAKTTFLNSVSHDIRNPLNAILGYAGLVLANAKDRLPEKQYENLRKLEAKGRELNELVHDFLDYTRADHVTTREFALSPLIQQCMATVEPMIGSRPIALVCDIPERPPTLIQDEQKLKRVIWNLLNNAAKFTERGEIRLTVAYRDDAIDVTVADTGIGIAREFQDRIFEEFERVEHHGERPREGTGLGLAICRRFAALMSGTISVKSDPGKGAAFTLSIPVTHPQASGAPKGATARSHAAVDGAARERAPVPRDGRATILVVDDSKENRDFLVQLLEQDYRILLAEDGRKAVETARMEHPDLILMDLSLPIMDGWEATRTIKGDSALVSIPIVAVTAHATVRAREDVRAAGCDEFLAKPVDEAALFELLHRYLAPRLGKVADG